MKEDIKLLKEKFNKIEKIGWLELNGTNFGNIGLTFEKLVGVNTNEFEIPDFGSIEIKTKSKSKFDFISLFNCVPTGPYYHEVQRIKDSFGYPDSKLKDYRVFNGDVFCSKLNKVGNTFYFKLNVYRKDKKITLSVYDKHYNKIEENTYWDFDILKEKLIRKLSYLALVNVDRKFNNGKKYFKYSAMSIYKLKNFDTFIDLIESGIIKITFKLGIYRDDKRLGKIHDRGTSFSIQERYIDKLFNYIE